MLDICLYNESDDQRFVLSGEEFTLGRARSNDVVIENLNVSRRHARIRAENGKAMIQDLGSSNGTLVNGKRINEETELIEGDSVSVGKYELTFTYNQAGHGIEELKTELPERTVSLTADSRFETDHHNPPTHIPDTAEMAELTGGEISDSVPVPAPPEDEDAPPPDLEDIKHDAPADDKPFIAVLRVRKGKDDNWSYQISKDMISLGRGQDNDLVLSDIFASKSHARIARKDGRYWIEDLGSWRGTQISGQPLKHDDGPRLLEHNDEIQIGSSVMLYCHEEVIGREPDGAVMQPPAAAEAPPTPPAPSDDADLAAIYGKRVATEPTPEPASQSENRPMYLDKEPENEEEFIQQFCADADVVFDQNNPLKLPQEAVAFDMDDFDDIDTNESNMINQITSNPNDTFSGISGYEEMEKQLDSASGEPLPSIEQMDGFSVVQQTETDQKELDPAVAAIAAIDEDTGGGFTETPEFGPDTDSDVRESMGDISEPITSPDDSSDAPPPAEDDHAGNVAPASEAQDINLADYDESTQKEIKMWQRALKSDKPMIKKEAQRRLKEITGTHYE